MDAVGGGRVTVVIVLLIVALGSLAIERICRTGPAGYEPEARSNMRVVARPYDQEREAS